MARVTVLDTTLRDGAQSEGVVFSREDKLKVIRALDALRIDYIEAGNPASNPKDLEFMRFVCGNLKLRHSEIVAFGSTCRVNVPADQDAGLLELAGCGARVVSVFGKSSPLHVVKVLKTSLLENLRMIRDSVQLLVGRGLRVFYDAEHFFDGYALNQDYALETLRAAKDGGAEIIALCDTNGGSLPGLIESVTARVVKELGLPVAIHCHNDAGLATACTLAGVAGGALQVQGTMNGYGERCGNADLCQVVPGVMLKMGLECLPEGKLVNLSVCARLVADIANLSVDEHRPYVGRSAFAHKGGMHIDGMLKDSRSFEHIDPASVGNSRRFLVSEMAGRGAVMTKLKRIAPELDKNSHETGHIIAMLKELEQFGYSFEGADGSLELRMLGALGLRRDFFSVTDFQVVSRKPESRLNAQAFIKVKVGDQQEITADEGDGPVNALDLALRKALTRFYPCLSIVRLADFKVRVVNNSGSASSVRVHIESTDGEHDWATVGVSSNIIEASFIALTDSIEYVLMKQVDGWDQE